MFLEFRNIMHVSNEFRNMMHDSRIQKYDARNMMHVSRIQKYDACFQNLEI